MKYIVTENKMIGIIRSFLDMRFPSINEVYYDWANFNCGMGECCDMYAIGFVLPESHYDDYLFKLVDSKNYRDYGNYKNYPDELPKPCKERPNIHDKTFDEIVISEDMYEPFEGFFGDPKNWGETLLLVLNNKFDIKAKSIKFIY